MSPDKNRSAGPRVRLAIARWPDDAPRGAVTTFGAGRGIWRKDAPASCAGARRGEGPAAAGEPRSRRPRCRPEPPARSGSRPGPRCARGSGGARDRGHGPISARRQGWPPWALRRPRRRGWPGSSVRRGWPGPSRPRDRGRRGAGSTCPAPNACRRARMPASTSWPAGARAVTWPAPGRPLPPGGGLAGRPGRDQSGGHRRLRQGRSRPGRAPAPADRQRRGPQPQPARSHRPPGGARALPGRRTPRRQTLQAHHPGATTSASTRPCSATRAGSPWPTPSPSPRETGRPLRPHPATPSAPTRACPGASPRSRPRTPARWPGRPDRATAPTPSPPAANPRATRPPGADRRTGAGPSPPAASAKPAITRNGTVHIGGIAFLVRRALAGHRTTAIWDATTITFADVHGEVLIQYNWPPEGVTYVSHHPPDPTNQRGGRGRRRPQPSPKS